MIGLPGDARPAPSLLGGPEIRVRRIPSDSAPCRDLCDATEAENMRQPSPSPPTEAGADISSGVAPAEVDSSASGATDAPRDSGPDHEIQSLERALGALDAAIRALGSASAIVTERLDETVERVAMPNSRRAEQQLVTALNAARGAERCLRRRVELRGRALVRGHSGAVVANDPGRPR